MKQLLAVSILVLIVLTLANFFMLQGVAKTTSRTKDIVTKTALDNIYKNTTGATQDKL